MYLWDKICFMDKVENIVDISPKNETEIIAQVTRIIVEDFLSRGRDIPEGFSSIPPTVHITPIKPREKNKGDAIGAVRYAFRTLREDNIPEQISSTLQMVRETLTPDVADIPLSSTTYERIFAQIVMRLRFAPVHTRRWELEQDGVHENMSQIVEIHMGFRYHPEENSIRANPVRTSADMINAKIHYDFSFVENYIGRINFLIRYAQEHAPGLIIMLNSIHQILVRFVSSVQTVLTDHDLTHDKKIGAIHTYHLLLF